jgi:bacterioferritin-associated ferredoxin
MADSQADGKDAEAKSVSENEIICACFDLRREQLRTVLEENPGMSFDDLLDQTKVGTRCTACLLDLEYWYVSLPRGEGRVQATRSPVGGGTDLSLKQRCYRWVDQRSPLAPMPLTEWMPVLVGKGIEQWVCIANHSLLYEGKECAPDFDVGIIVRDAGGRTTYSGKHPVERGASVRLNVSKFLALPVQEGRDLPLGIGSVEISRHARQPGCRGTIRPQVEIVTGVGSCAVHTQAPGGQVEQWVACMCRPAEERLFLSVVNPWNKPLDVEFAYPFAWEGAPDVVPAIMPVRIPPRGARLHEIRMPDPVVRQLNGQLFSVRWRAIGARKVHIFCASPNLDRFSIDHL